MNIVILAGGSGKRLWPLGRQNSPKQFFPILTDKPLVKETYERFRRAYRAENIFFSVTAALFPSLRKIFSDLPRSQFIVEPEQRDTAPAMGYVAAILSLADPDEPMVFVPSDHFVSDLKKYLQCFYAGEELIKKTGKMLDIGVTADFPSTVLGYTKIGRKYGVFHGAEVYRFQGHAEKPDLKTAKKYLAAGRHLWHANYYMWTPRRFLEAIGKNAPPLGKNLKKILGLLSGKNKEINKDKEIKNIYKKMPKISFDYAVTEKMGKKDVLIIKGDFGWSDIGAWDVLHRQLSPRADAAGNLKKGRVFSLDTRNCLLFGREEKVLAVLGLDNLAVVDTVDALLICPKDRAQDLKKMLAEMEKKGLKKFL